uniref:hypothetical protein n=1 Tax=uncultured Bacteroides sp. TaxID=162156 RepID=UPI00280C198C
VLTVNGYGGRQTKENEKSWCFKGWETLDYYKLHLCKLFTIKMPNVSLFITIGYIRAGEVEVSHSPIPFLQPVPCGCHYKMKKV